MITRLQQHPARNITHELLALTLRITAEPGRRAAILEEAIAHYRETEPEKRVRFAVWLNQNGEAERTLVALPLEEALKRKDFFLPYIDAMAGLGRWLELRKILETKQSPMESAYVEAFQARDGDTRASAAEIRFPNGRELSLGNPTTEAVAAAARRSRN